MMQGHVSTQRNELIMKSAWAHVVGVMLVIGAVTGCSSQPRAFTDAETAVHDLMVAARDGDTADLNAIFGPDGKEVLSSGDPVADRHQREVFAVAMSERWTLESIGDDTQELIVGDEEWPFPIPLVKNDRGWSFDTAAGRDEILARRIGRNELAAIGSLQAYVGAQEEYASQGHDGRPAGLYAQRVRSTPGRHDGLYWADGDAAAGPSPLSEFTALAVPEGYSVDPGGAPAPFRGYEFRILTKQGPTAPGGAKSYMSDRGMTEGFAMIAHPADYGNSGIMTFLVGPDGTIFETDLGEATERVADAIDAYEPDERWVAID